VPFALLAIGDLYLKAEDYYEALAYYNLVVKKHKDSKAAGRALIQKARILFTNKKRNESMATLQQVVREYPGLPEETEAKIEMAKIVHEMNDFRQSLTMLSELAKADPHNIYRYPQISLYLGYNYYQLGYSLKAREYLLRFYNSCPDREMSHLVLTKIADTYRDEGLMDDAVKLYQLVIDQYPDQEGALISLIRLAELQEQGELETNKGIVSPVKITGKEIDVPTDIYKEILNGILSKDKDNPLAQLAHLKLAILYYNENDYASSFKILKALLEEHPRSKLRKEIEEAFGKTLAAILREEMKYRRHHTIINIYLKEQGLFYLAHSPDPFLTVARAAMRLNLQDLATEMFQKADPLLCDADKPPDLLYSLGRRLLEKDQLTAAMARLDLLTTRYPKDKFAPHAYQLKGKIFAMQKRYADADTMFSSALRYDLRPCDRAKILLDKARALIACNSKPKALAATREADQLKGSCYMETWAIYEEVGNLYLQLGYPAEALAVFANSSSKGTGTDNEILLTLKVAQYYRHSGKKEESLPLYDQVSSLNDPLWSNLAKERIEEFNFNRELAKMQAEEKTASTPKREVKPVAEKHQQPSPPQKESEVEEIKEMLTTWQKAWQEKALEVYMGHYADDFTSRGMNRSAWRKQKARVNGKTNSIVVTISKVTIRLLTRTKATVSFEQDYRSDNYHDRGTKTLVLIKRGEAWKITRETWRP
jgi:TolA-binding protein